MTEKINMNNREIMNSRLRAAEELTACAFLVFADFPEQNLMFVSFYS